MVRDAVVPDAQNGLVMFRKMNMTSFDFATFSKTRGVNEDDADKILERDARNDAVADDFLKQARPHFVEIDHVLDAPVFSFNDEITVDSKAPDFEPLRPVLCALRLSIIRCQQTGDYAGAIRDAVRLRRFGLRFSEGYKPLMYVLYSTALNSAYYYECAELLNDRSLPPTARDRLASEFTQETPWAERYQRCMPIEYQFLVGVIHQFKNAPTKDLKTMLSFAYVKSAWMQFTLQENATRRMMLPYYRTLMTSYNYPYSHFDPHTVNPFFMVNWIEKGWLNWLKPNYGGMAFLYDMGGLTNYWASASLTYAQIAKERELKVGFALRHYYDDHEALPAKLADLIPQYLPAVPLDPFDGQPLRYDAKQGLVYSVGASLKDNGGSRFVKMAKDDPNYEDPLFSQDQPTLQLTFQNPSNASGPVDVSAAR